MDVVSSANTQGGSRRKLKPVATKKPKAQKIPKEVLQELAELKKLMQTVVSQPKIFLPVHTVVLPSKDEKCPETNTMCRK